MRVHVETTPIEDLLVVVPEVFEDERGFFMEVYHQEEFRKAGL
ncbi:MAG: dTDP-4-dehydrorhamnose 3,5-epimerase family protein, partial [Gemmatimonadota bacterium]|nr:dTDP-4-dehydrorhamnose 3,5-epimerase family protein [Gemmatimonadota bacterium]